MSDLSAQELRALVREVLLDVLPDVVTGLAADRPGPRVERVRVRDDADLAAFAARVLEAADDVRAGRVVFSLADAAPAAAPSTAPSGHRVERGAVTERHVRAAEAAGGRLVLGRGAVLTPLARDRARARGVEVVRSTDPGRS